MEILREIGFLKGETKAGQSDSGQIYFRLEDRIIKLNVTEIEAIRDHAMPTAAAAQFMDTLPIKFEPFNTQP